MGLANIQTQVTEFNGGFIAAHKKVWINLEASTIHTSLSQESLFPYLKASLSSPPNECCIYHVLFAFTSACLLSPPCRDWLVCYTTMEQMLPCHRGTLKMSPTHQPPVPWTTWAKDKFINRMDEDECSPKGHSTWGLSRKCIVTLSGLCIPTYIAGHILQRAG